MVVRRKLYIKKNIIQIDKIDMNNLNEVSRQCYLNIIETVTSFRFNKNYANLFIYFKIGKGRFMILVFCDDDILYKK